MIEDTLHLVESVRVLGHIFLVKDNPKLNLHV
jgi:hypothetical protein